MELWQRFWAAALVALLAASASAMTVTGRSSTVLEWYDTPRGDTAACLSVSDVERAKHPGYGSEFSLLWTAGYGSE